MYKLTKALYGLGKAPMVYNKRIYKFFVEIGLKKCYSKHGVYVKGKEGEILLIISIYVDDLIETRSYEKEIDKLKANMKLAFEMYGLGKLVYFLGMEFLDSSMGMVMHQEKYACEILSKFKMLECNSKTTVANTIVKFRKADAGEKKRMIPRCSYEW